MGSGHSHRPIWPPYRRDVAPPERTLAIWDGKMIVTEEGECFDIYNADDFCNAVFDHNLLLLTDSLVNFSYLYDLVLSGRHEVLCTDKGRPSIIMLKWKNRKRFMVKSSLWNKDIPAGPILLKGMRRLFKYIGLGVKPTPSSLGKETMRVTWLDYNLPSLTTPSLLCERYIKSTCSGCIVSTPALELPYIGAKHNTAILLDRKSAFPAEMVQLPIGTAIMAGNNANDFPLWYGKCRVIVNEDVPLGPFPVRTRRTAVTDAVEYPRTFGAYDTYLWNFQFKDCEKVGMHVYPQSGYAWEQTTDDATLWTEEMYDFRQRAEDEEVASYVKIVTNAAIGGLGTNRVGYRLVPEELATEYDEPMVSDEGEPKCIFIQQQSRDSEPIMSHWWHCNIARNNSAVFNFALPYAIEKRLLWINFDAIMITDGEEIHFYPEKKLSTDAPMGTWTSELLHEVEITAPRAYDSLERKIRPGRPQVLDFV